MGAGPVMQHATHNRPRFFVNARGVLMDRQATGAARRTGYSIEANRATRSEMQILADLLNEPGRGEAFDAGEMPLQEWALRADLRRAVQWRPIAEFTRSETLDCNPWFGPLVPTKCRSTRADLERR